MTARRRPQNLPGVSATPNHVDASTRAGDVDEPDAPRGRKKPAPDGADPSGLARRLAAVERKIRRDDDATEMLGFDIDMVLSRIANIEKGLATNGEAVMAIRSDAVDQALRLADMRVGAGDVDAASGLSLSVILSHAEVLSRYVLDGTLPVTPNVFKFTPPAAATGGDDDGVR